MAIRQDPPLLRQLLLSGAADEGGERLWLLRLLAAGLRSPADGAIFRCLVGSQVFPARTSYRMN